MKAKILKWMGARPLTCQMCGGDFRDDDEFVDGKVVGGPWAIMCLLCHKAFGWGLGTGKGQKYSIKTLEKIDG